jgi:hypothetical protein
MSSGSSLYEALRDAEAIYSVLQMPVWWLFNTAPVCFTPGVTAEEVFEKCHLFWEDKDPQLVEYSSDVQGLYIRRQPNE